MPGALWWTPDILLPFFRKIQQKIPRNSLPLRRRCMRCNWFYILGESDKKEIYTETKIAYFARILACLASSFKITTSMQHKLIFQYLISVAYSIKISMVFIKNRLFDIPHAIYVYSKGTESPPNTQSSFASCLVSTSTPDRLAISAAVVTCFNMGWGHLEAVD